VVTGGQGFIGSHLCDTLLELGAQVTSIDADVPGLGAHPGNLERSPGLRTIGLDLRDPAVPEALAGAETVFHLASHSGHRRSMDAPRDHLAWTVDGTLALLEACRDRAPRAHIVAASTRQLYGPTLGPLDESHPLAPPDVDGLHKRLVEDYLAMLGPRWGLTWTSLRLTNTYGPRQPLKTAASGVMGNFLRRGLSGMPLEVFEPGTDRRSFAYVDDVVLAFVHAAADDACRGRAWNAGGAEVSTIRGIAERIAEQTGVEVLSRPFPAERVGIDVGDHVLVDHAFRQETGWTPSVGLDSGLERTLAFFRRHPDRWSAG
jgi:nucleoside-diphosphate-sugar epimerase